jgi:ABC-type multidrug transport system ATPase subunit
MTNSTAISVEQISKRFGEKTLALDKIDLQVQRGELFGLIGPDGAGKTTLIRILCSLILADSGRAIVENWDVVKDYRKIRANIGYMPGRFSLYQDLSVEENLRFFATIFGTTITANYDLIKDIYVQIEPFKKRKAGKLSGGMKQKLALCCALIHKPKVLLLDEPTTGVDAVSRKEFWEMLKQLRDKGITILVSTPYMDEASLCERVALIQEGRILDIASPEKIIQKFDKHLLAVRSDKMYQLIEDLRQMEQTHSAFPFGEYVHLASKESISMEEVRQYLVQKGHHQPEIKEAEPNIEDCFMDLMI